MASTEPLKIGNLRYAAVELDAVAGAIANRVLERAAETTVLTIRWLDEDGNELNETQQIKLVSTLMRCFDGTEQEIREELERDHSTTTRVELRAVEGSGA